MGSLRARIDMKCDFALCKITNIKQPFTCVWCNRHFHKQCLLQYRCNPNVLFVKTHNIQCNFCNPKRPFQTENDRDNGITIYRYGINANKSLEMSKSKYERQYIYPIGFCSTRRFPSYKTPGQMTTIKLEIACVDECFFEMNVTGKKDVYLFRVTFQDDLENSINVLRSLRLVTSKINEKYTSKKINSSAIKLFGLDNIYIQYLISIHVPGAQEISITSSETKLQEIYDKDQIDKCISFNETTDEFLYSVNTGVWARNKRCFDPQKQLFYF